ncbi:MAG TPA: hypothetical protein VN240_07130 [Propylenella sp.]|nr:hypothetical protein [Propylenella sp.]
MAVTRDALKAADDLSDLGVDSAFRFVEHARDWDSVELSVHSTEGS